MNAKLLLTFALVLSLSAVEPRPAHADSGIPRFTLDQTWPKPLPNRWQIGGANGVFVDRHDLIWVANESNKLNGYDLALDNGNGECCSMAPQIIAFDRAGNVVKSWNVSGGPGACRGYRCFSSVHDIYVDHKDNVWVGGYRDGDTHLLKFDYDGKFLLQIGGSLEKGCCGNQDKENVQHAAGIAVWPATNEVFVADGYVNRRVIVFDADTGRFKRMWGAYGRPPPLSTLMPLSALAPRLGVLPGENPAKVVMATADPVRRFEGEGASQWSTVHGVAITPDGIVWIADRYNNRIQQFKIDGTYIREAFVSRKSRSDTGTVYHFSFSPDFRYVYVADGWNKQVHILERESLKEVGTIGNCGGAMAGCFDHLHVTGVDSAGNIYTGEASGARVQRWNLTQ